MRKEDLARFRKILMLKRELLSGDVSTLQNEALRKNRHEASGDLSNMPIHMADVGSDNFEQEFTLGLIENEETTLREIDEALKRIDDQTFGKCTHCEKSIPVARLKAKPHARYCIECKRLEEKGLL
ncbi:MAG TPA: TraR/DksA C4-type zinc finger protein [Phycisphaerae bacterium]|nr:TraR/DksA family transcriptional regulator [Phycisphaerae bacterium]HOI54470.1 TraR/DksA C4-type zinc finger protein [Phycisphaerae bacterium]